MKNALFSFFVQSPHCREVSSFVTSGTLCGEMNPRTRGARISITTALIVMVLCISGRAEAESPQLSRIERSTVRVFTCHSLAMKRLVHEGRQVVVAVPEVGHGSGLVVTDDGLILTARHVIENASGIAVKMPLAASAMPAVVVYQHPELDFAFLKVRGTIPAHVPLPSAGAVKSLSTRDSLFSIGYPLDPSASTPTTQEGIISRLTEEGLLQTSAALNPGHSGGPAFVERGGRNHLIGIAIARARRGEGMGFIQPIRPVVDAWQSENIQTERVSRVMAQYEQNPRLWQAMEAYSMLVADMTEAFSDRDNPSYWFNMPSAGRQGVPSFMEGLSFLAVEHMLPEAQLLVSGYLWNLFVANRNEESLRQCVQIVMHLRDNHPVVFAQSPFAQSLANVVEQVQQGGGAFPGATPGMGVPGAGGLGYAVPQPQPNMYGAQACGVEGGPCCGRYCTEGLNCVYGLCVMPQECNDEEPCPEDQVCSRGVCGERTRFPLFRMLLAGGMVIDDHQNAPWVNGGAGTVGALFQVLRRGDLAPWRFSLVVGAEMNMGGWRKLFVFTALADVGVRLLLGSPRVAATMALYYRLGVAVAEGRTTFAYLGYRAMAGVQIRTTELGIAWSETGRGADSTFRTAELYLSWGF